VIHLARVYGERKRNFVGQSFWARGYFVSMVGRDEKAIREYIHNQEKEDQRLGATQPLEVTATFRWPMCAALVSPLAAHLSGQNQNSRVSDDTAALSG
jgi:Transposase IS200 like